MSSYLVSEQDKNRIRMILKCADRLKWIYPIEQPNTRHFSYPLMQLSEVEKCMLALINFNEFRRLCDWAGVKI